MKLNELNQLNGLIRLNEETPARSSLFNPINHLTHLTP